MRDEKAPIMIDLTHKPTGYDDWRAADSDWAAESDGGWLNEAKGLKQYVFERGFWHPSGEQSLDGTKDEHGVLKEWVETVRDSSGRDREVRVSSSLREVAGGFSDFQNEPSVLSQLIKELGHTSDFTPKCHPELAGEGIEYDWGKSAHAHRHIFNEQKQRQHRANVIASLGPSVLPLERARRFERVAWRYKEVYRKLHANSGDMTEFEHRETERLQMQMQKHRGVDAELRLLETGALDEAGFLS